jgi:hypothetical protein
MKKVSHALAYILDRAKVPYFILGAIRPVEPGLAFEDSTDSVGTSAQAALAPHQTMGREISVDTTLMAM